MTSLEEKRQEKLPEGFIEIIKKGNIVSENYLLTHFFLNKNDVIEIISKYMTLYVKAENIVKGKLSLKRQTSLVVGPAIFFLQDNVVAGDIALELPVYVGGKRYINYSSIELEKIELHEKDIEMIYIYKKKSGKSILNKLKELLFKTKQT